MLLCGKCNTAVACKPDRLAAELVTHKVSPTSRFRLALVLGLFVKQFSRLFMLQKGQSAKLVPAEPGLLAEASRWVDSWQEPTGHTNYDAALQMAERYLEADCEYIFSDGLSDYAVVLLEVRTHHQLSKCWVRMSAA